MRPLMAKAVTDPYPPRRRLGRFLLLIFLVLLVLLVLVQLVPYRS
jgi:hypothetical protein